MPEYIERKATLKEAESRIMWGLSATAVYEAIQEAPAADVVPVVHGRWDKIPNSYISVAAKDGSYSGNATSCSVCKEINPNAYRTNYCPNCGAKMDGGDGNEAD